MNLNIEKYLYAIDKSFAEKNERDAQLIYVMIIAGFFTFSYLLFWESSEQDYQKIKAQSQMIQQKLNADQGYLRLHPESQISAIENQIVDIDKQTVQVKDDNDYIEFKISKIPELYYNEVAWGKYIDSISENARKYNVKLKMLSNAKSNDTNRFGHVLDIQVAASGKFNKIIQFINSMEKSSLVVDIHDFDITASKILDVNISSSVWGITH